MKLSLNNMLTALKTSFAPRGKATTPEDIFAAAEAGHVHTVMIHFDTDFAGMGAPASNAELLARAAANSNYGAVARMLDYNARTAKETFDGSDTRFMEMCEVDPVLMALKLAYDRMAEEGSLPMPAETSSRGWNLMI